MPAMEALGGVSLLGSMNFEKGRIVVDGAMAFADDAAKAKLEELYGLYENAIRAERARYNALLEAHTPPGENHEEGC